MGTGVLGNFNWGSWGGYNGYNPLTPCGYCDSIGNGTGVKSLSTKTFTYGTDSTSVPAYTFNVPRWRGFDNPFGDIYTNLDGIILDNTDVYIILNSNKYSDSLSDVKNYASSDMRKLTDAASSSGWITGVEVGNYADTIPTTVSGSSTTYSDYYYTTTSTGSGFTCLVGGRVAFGADGGLFCLRANNGLSFAYALIGARGVRVVA